MKPQSRHFVIRNNEGIKSVRWMAYMYDYYALIDDYYALIDDYYALIDDYYALIDDHYALIDDHYALIDDYYAPIDDYYALIETILLACWQWHTCMTILLACWSGMLACIVLWAKPFPLARKRRQLGGVYLLAALLCVMNLV